MTPPEAMMVILVGLATGLIGGLTGIGGSIIMIPALTELFGPRQHLYQATAMIVNFAVVIPAVYQHARAKAIQWDWVGWAFAGALVSVVAGVLCSDLPVFAGKNQILLTGLFGLFLFYVAASQVYELMHRASASSIAESKSGGSPRRGSSMGVGAIMGFMGGLLGVGGGIVVIPIQMKWFKVPLRNAIANSAFLIIGVALVGAAFKNYTLVTLHGHSVHESLALAASLIPTAMLGSFVGSRLTHALPVRLVQGALLLIMGVSGWRMCWRAIEWMAQGA